MAGVLVLELFYLLVNTDKKRCIVMANTQVKIITTRPMVLRNGMNCKYDRTCIVNCMK